MTSKLFVDSDTLLDFLLDRPPFADYSEALLNRNKKGIYELGTSALVIANIHYIITKSFSRNNAKLAIAELIQLVNVYPLKETHIQSAIDSNYIDFEDSIQYYIAKENNCEMIISRNLKHYKAFDIATLTAEQFLRTL